MRALYSLSIFFFGISIRIASLFNSKARLWISGRKNLFDKLEEHFQNNKGRVAWFHCASLGEFEQGRPLLEEFKKRNPDYKILLTFFSPSGYEVRKNYAGADIICYIPLDTKSNARRFLKLVNPTVVYFVKYEFWLNFLGEFRKNKISHFLVSAIFREDQIFFKTYGSIFRDALKGFTFIFTQEKKSIDLLNSIGIDHAEIAGDTRFDRVAQIAANAKEIQIAKSFSGEERKVIVAGSTWPSDEKIIFPVLGELIQNEWKLIIAPHELSENHLLAIEKGLLDVGVSPVKIIRYSQANENNSTSSKVLIIDNIGMLSALYAYGRIAFIGGGFGKSIHNILEAAVFGMPVIFGPRFEKFNEAFELIENGAAFGINNENELKKILDKVSNDPQLLELLSNQSREFVQNHRGATNKILEKSNSLINH
ncbi:MAG: 3-deoxy-D-manno-octulosonic acid transferase [Bacteroidetes bacterium]|nr:3-deoxy-D-manno-octulosonic acid transferase [Bacteroidota bacterium]